MPGRIKFDAIRYAAPFVFLPFLSCSGGNLTHKKPEQHHSDSADIICACKAGKRQSPIDIRNEKFDPEVSERILKKDLRLIQVEKTGHSATGRLDKETALIFNNQLFDILQFHFHTPAEHTVHGGRFPMEMHMVHEQANGSFAVVSVLFKLGAENPWLGNVLALFEGKSAKSGAQHYVNFSGLLTEKKGIYAYDGSLTTPPCTEGVQWLIYKDPISVSASQITRIRAIEGHNARPVQKVNDRKIGGN